MSAINMGKGYNQESKERKLLEGEIEKLFTQTKEKDVTKKTRKESC